MQWLEVIESVLPVFVDWLKSVFSSSDEEFEKITSAWPYPTKTHLARLRAEHKAALHFGVEE